MESLASECHNTDREIDGNDTDPIVICGLSIKFPQDATSLHSFWQMISERRCAMTEFPSDRVNTDGFYHATNRLNALRLRGGHFIKDDLSAFDAEFFSVSPTEAASMDPTQRWLLETAYRALENGGIPMESVSDSLTAVYVGSFTMDYMLQLVRDPETPPAYAATGFGLSMLANRLSWFFNLRGASIGLDTACSSSAVAVDIACQALQNRSCNMALVAGCNLANCPESYIWMSNLSFLSADSRCYSFDHRANGYARGEGVGVLVLKRLSDAIRDGNIIRAVIRSTASNEDGRTPGITQPSRKAQEELIALTYKKAALSMAHTRFFEAHGTGTPVGDVREAQAIGSVFQKHRSSEDPLYVGSVKSNIGHLEGASGLAGIIKTVLALEKGIIPPNANFEKTNPKIDADFLRLHFPTKNYAWPTTGLRRASVNSFGYGGSNAHIVLDDAYNYLRLRHLRGNHCTIPFPRDESLHVSAVNETSNSGIQVISPKDTRPILLVWSAADKNGINRIIEVYRNWYQNDFSSQRSNHDDVLEDLAFTLNVHRSHLQWRSFAVLRSIDRLNDLQFSMSTPLRMRPKVLRIGFIFNGQGSQWPGMGRELICYASFRKDINHAENYLRTLGCTWSLMDELLKSDDSSNIDDAEISQTLCTVLQIALVNLLRKFHVEPCAVVGHSSGEIAASYAAGYLSCESALRIAYFRGRCSAELSKSSDSTSRGAMMSVGLSEDVAKDIIAASNQASSNFGVTIACINSPNNVTLSGEEKLIDDLRIKFDGEKIFARKLRVPLAYHSRQINAITSKFTSLIGLLSAPSKATQAVPMLSTVTGKRVVASRLKEPSYWAAGMVSPVLFSVAVGKICSRSSSNLSKKIDMSHQYVSAADHLIEIGPHATLKGVVQEITQAFSWDKRIGYSSVLTKGRSATETVLQTMGKLHCMGVCLDLREINEPQGEQKMDRSLLVNLPEYPFDHSQTYWHESRLSRNYRLRTHAPSELLGVRSTDWNAAEARWRHFIRSAEIPWVEQHDINGETLYPGAGMLVMAIEAAKQLVGNNHSIDGYTLRDIQILAPIKVNTNAELQISMHKIQASRQNEPNFNFFIRTPNSGDDWLLNCRGSISVTLSDLWDDWEKKRTANERKTVAENFTTSISSCAVSVNSDNMYKFLSRYGYNYGPHFQAAGHQYCSEETNKATAEIKLHDSAQEEHVVHPVSLDAILHLCFTAFTSGGQRSMATSIPSRIGHLWISDKGLSSPDTQTVTAFSSVTSTTNRGFSFRGAAIDSGDGTSLRLWGEDIQMTNVTSTPVSNSLPNPKQFCMGIECKVDISKLSIEETVDLLNSMHPVSQGMSDFFRDLELLVNTSLRLLVTCTPETSVAREAWQMHYREWAQYHSVQAKRLVETEEEFRHLCDRVRSTSSVGRVFETVSSNLLAFVQEEVSPLELLLQSGMLKEYYQELTSYRCTKQVASYIDLLTHQKPGMTILELGGGTSSATRNIIGAISSKSNGHRASLRCSRYDFTDISPAFLDQARQEFQSYDSQMTFGTLDVEQDFSAQGYQKAGYDVVIADNVLHITRDLVKTLQNVREALKPGGKLIIHELLNPSGWITGFIFGLFPGWWRGTQDNRVLSPNVSADTWDGILKASGFSGTDIILRDFEDQVAHQLGQIISTAIEVTPSPIPQLSRGRQITIIIDQDNTEQLLLARDLCFPLQRLVGSMPSVLRIDHALSADRERESNELVIFLADYKDCFLGGLDITKWQYLKRLIQGSYHLLWVSSGGGPCPNPDSGILDGFARTMRSEYYELHLVILALDATKVYDPNTDRNLVMRVVSEMLDTRSGYYEEEYIVINARLHTRRLVAAHDLKSTMDAKLRNYEIVSVSLREGQRIQISTELNSPFTNNSFYRESSPYDEGDLAHDAIEILVKAVTLQDYERDSAETTERDSSFGSCCSGVVLSAGPGAKFQPGDRVFASSTGSFQSHVRVASAAVVKIPPALSFVDVCHIAPPRLIIYHALVEVGRIKDTDVTIILDGAGFLGQAALRLLLDCGVKDIWTTAADKKACMQIIRTFGIPEERILPMSWFHTEKIIGLQWKQKFDVIFSSDLNFETPVLISLGKSGSRCIILSTSNRSFHSPPVIDCVSPSTTSLFIIRPGDPTLSTSLTNPSSLQYAVAFSHLESITYPTLRFPASNLMGALNELRNVGHCENIVVDMDENISVDVRVNSLPGYLFDSQSTYLIAGGLGGLGREMARWLVKRGATHLILPSRSGPRTPEARQLLAEFASEKVYVDTPRCDLTDRNALRSMLVRCSEKMPPIRGCIQSTMVMTELVFQKMEFDHWKATIDSKVKVSWNLHLELSEGLDFFVLISSMMGIMGSGSLAAYNAGNTYENSLAHYRVSQGERAVSLNLGAVPDGGYLIEHGNYIPSMMRTEKYALTYVKELCALLEIFCNNDSEHRKSFSCQPIIGIRPPAHWKDVEDVPSTMSQPFWGHMHHVPVTHFEETHSLDALSARQSRALHGSNVVEKMTAADSLPEAANIAAEALADRIAIILGSSKDRLDSQKPLQSYGMDSLSAIDLRNWVGKTFDVDLPISDIFGGITLTSAAMTIVQRIRNRGVTMPID